MKQYRFYYRRNALHKIQLVVLGGLGLLMLSFALLAVGKLPDAQGADFEVFIFLALGMGLPALALIWFSVWYFRRISRFFQRDDWYGVTISGNNLHLLYFDMLRTSEWEMELSSITSAFAGSNRGRRWICVKSTARTRFIPSGQLREEDRDALLAELKKYEKQQ